MGRPKKYVVLGLGRSGTAAVAYLRNKNIEPTVWDDDPQKLAASQKPADPPPILAKSYQFNGDEILVVSPGIRTLHKPHPLAARAKAAGCRMTCEERLRIADEKGAKLLTVSGTNGKSTMAAMLAHMLCKNGRKAKAAGNIGQPLCAVRGSHDYYVLELSSYQLEIAGGPQAEVATLLNIGQDHSEYHGGRTNYIRAKARLFADSFGLRGEAQGGLRAKAAVIGIDDEPCLELWQKLRQKLPTLAVSIRPNSQPKDCDILLKGETLRVGDEEFDLAPYVSGPAGGGFLAPTAAFAVAAAKHLGIAPKKALAGLAGFAPLPHRAEEFARYRRVTFINDSKATNVEATEFALKQLGDLPLFWIAGGLAKLGGFRRLRESLGAVKHGFFIGRAAEQLSKELGALISHSRFSELSEATAEAFGRALAYGRRCRVLLSPACASQDQWSDFGQRGMAFKTLVQDMVAKRTMGNVS